MEIKKAFPDNAVLGIDQSAGMLKAFDSRAKQLNWKNVKTKLVDAEEKTGTRILSDFTFHSYISNPRPTI